MTHACSFPPLASIEAVRPVFMIVMGIFLMVIAWRLSKVSTGWTARMIVAGSLLLGFGYALLMPLYEAGLIERYSAAGHYHSSGANAVAWQAVKMVAMNSGWLIFGLGIAMHAKILGVPAPRRATPPPPRAKHDAVA